MKKRNHFAELGRWILLFLSLVSTTILYSQEHGQIKGVVVDLRGNTLEGVTIIAKNQINNESQTVSSDTSGMFQLNMISIGERYTLRLTLVGYEPKEVKDVLVSSNNDISLLVRLMEQTASLDEVVVVGYGTQRKGDLTGSTSVLKGDDLATSSNLSVGSAMQGKMPGVSILSRGGFPGAGTDISIRGIGTFGTGDNAPLIVIDGTPVDGGFETLSPTDIASISVLKDAASAAIYGSRSANGVIMVTTKKGGQGSTKVNLNVHYGSQKASNIMAVLNAREFVEMIIEMRDNKKKIDGGNPITNYDGLDPSTFGEGTTWSNHIYEVAPTHNINGNISGGNQKGDFYLSGDYLRQKGVGINTGYDRASFRSNTASRVGSRLTVSNNAHLAFQNFKGDQSNRISDVIFNAPIIPAYDEDGTYGEAPAQTSSKNAIPEVTWRTPNEKRYRILDNLSLDYKFSDFLRFKFNGGLDLTFNEYERFSPIYNDGGQTNARNSLDQRRGKNLMWITDYLLYFDKRIGRHSISAMTGFSKQLQQNDNMIGKRYDYVSEVENIQVFNGSTNTTDIELTGGKGQLAQSSYLGRLNYDYLGKYLLSMNVRADGSSRFKDDNRWGIFPSAALGWRISSEPFFRFQWINDLKVRASFGQLGNQSIGTWYPTVAALARQAAIFGVSDNAQQLYYGYSITSLGNRNLKWETTNVTDLGIDLSMFKNKLNFTGDYFIKQTDGILRSMILPPSIGLGSPKINYASVLNRGLELNLNYRDQIGDFTYSLTGNLSFIHNEIKKLSTGADFETITAPYGGLRINRVGDPVDALFGYRTDGLIVDKEEADFYREMGQGNAKIGRYKYIDQNGDGLISLDDREILGSHIPKATSGMTINLSYKNWDLNSVFIGVFGRKQHSPMSFQNRFPNRNMSRHWYDNRWILGEDSKGKYPLLIQSENYEEMTDLMVTNSSFAKWKMLTIGYNLNIKDVVRARLYMSAENILTITSKSFDGFDPENGNSYGHYTNWGGDYPTPRIIMFGINLNL